MCISLNGGLLPAVFSVFQGGKTEKKAVRCTKMKTDKIVAIGLKQLKTVLCHCGITDGERPFRETLHTTEIETGTSRRIANGV
ncbi:hypothetical protein [Agrobacterium tumefaciens]|uniref:hypothetical protein n=2 Tax=Rhizobium/Agrobacterium group TaxID=227290 RepID=UPI0015732C13|nr:hypothetical protein [Agrobacterium tumefaciens]NTE35326.1 hypothetical protein [Agrobacterium tumefaciens]NTE50836.1 hypothetical protein [Agrobacterium tumefaciens]